MKTKKPFYTRNPKKIAAEINKVNPANARMARERGYYNCWGFTAAFLGWEDELDWITERTMERHLAANSVPVKYPRRGDIAVYRDACGELNHTAIITDGRTRTIVQKPGGWNLEVSKVKDAIRRHAPYYGPVVEYRRPV